MFENQTMSLIMRVLLKSHYETLALFSHWVTIKNSE